MLVRCLSDAGRLALWLFAAALLVVGTAFAAFTWAVLPNLDRWRPELERYLSQSVGREVHIGKLTGSWQDVAPRLSLHSFTLSNPRNGRALTLDGVSIVPSWASLLHWSPRFSSIEIDSPNIELVRGKDGVLYLNGVDISSSSGGSPDSRSDSRFGNWVLSQDRVVVHGAALGWRDEWLGLPVIALESGDLELSDSLFGHRLHVEGKPQQALGQAISFDARWHGDDLAQFANWSGKASLKLQGARVGAWSRYLERFGLLRSGQGNGELLVQFDKGQLTSLAADISVREAGFRPVGARDIHLPEFAGKLDIQRGSDGIYRAHAHDLTLSTDAGIAFNHANADGQFRHGADGFGELTLDNVDLAPLAPVIHALAMDQNPLFGRFAPSGKLSSLSASWKGAFNAPRSYRLATRFDRLGWVEDGAVPGLSGASGEIHFDEKGGELTLDSRNTQVSLGRVFAKPLAFARLKAAIEWERQPGGVAARIRKVDFANADLAGALNGRYFYSGRGAGQIDLDGKLVGVNAVRVPDYLPYVIGRDTIAWLTHALQGGTARSVTLKLQGDLDHFPFKGGKGGQFSVRADIEHGRLRFDRDWPELENIKALLAFENEKMTVAGQEATTLGVPLKNVLVTIPDLESHGHGHLLIDGTAQGPLARMLAYTVKSPVDRWLSGFTGQLAAGGDARLGLKVDLPLDSASGDKEKVAGTLDFAGNTLKFTQLPVPPASAVNGRLNFNEQGIDIKSLRLATLGGSFALKADTDSAGKMRFALDGEADSHQLLEQYVSVLAPFVDGRSRYQIRFVVGKGLEQLSASSTLMGTRFTSPVPADKAASSAMPLSLQLRPDAQSHGAMALDYVLEQRARGTMKIDGNGSLQAGTVLIGSSDGSMPAHGIAVRVRHPLLDLDAWRAALDKVPGGGAGDGSMPLEIELNADTLQLGGYKLAKATSLAVYDRARHGWHIDLAAQEGAGVLDMRDNAKAPLRLRFSHLALPLPEATAAAAAGGKGGSWSGERYPAMDFQADNVSWHGREIGRVEFAARRESNNWSINRLRVSNRDGFAEGSLVANEDTVGHQRHVEAMFQINASDWGSMLSRVGEPNRVISGKGTLKGHLSWDGGLVDADVARLNGNVALDVKDGRFAKLDPGAARLLGVLSLQSLGRRLRLDFSDVFQSGLTFDKLAGEASVQQGVFRSDKIALQGPSANITLKGEVDLAHERQRLEVHVVPSLSESAALGAALVNPIAGVAALAAQKVLQDPLNKLFSIDYLVTGSLTDPDVQQVGGRKGAAAPVVKKP